MSRLPQIGTTPTLTYNFNLNIMKKFILNLVFVLAIVNLYAQQKGTQADTATSEHGHAERKIKELKESEQYDLVDLCGNRFVRAKGTGESITNINAAVENLTRKKIKVVVNPGTYFVAGDGYQNMVTRKEYAFVLNPLSRNKVRPLQNIYSLLQVEHFISVSL